MCLAVCFGGISLGYSDATEEFHKTIPLREGASVRVSNISGKIDLSSWDQTYADVLAVKKTSRGRDELSRVAIDVNTDGGLDIDTVYDSARREGSLLEHILGGMQSSPQVSVYYTIRIPRTAVLSRVKSVSGEIDVRDVRGDGDVLSVSGDIAVAGAQGSIEIQSTSGNIHVDGAVLRNVRTVSGDIRLKNVQGDFRVHSTSGNIETAGTGGMVEAHTVSGDMAFSGLVIRGADSISGNISLTPAGFAEEVKLTSVSGDIRIRVPSGVNADLTMNTVSGDLVNRSGRPLTMTQVSRRQISGKLGSGGPMIQVRTTSGNVTLE